MSTTRSKATRKVTAPVREKPSGNGLPFWRQWVAATGRTVFGCWFGWEEYWEDWSTSEFSSTRLTLSALAGLAMRVMLVLAPILLTLGLTLWAVGSVFSRHTIPLIGEACLAGFLVAVASGFFLLGLIGVVAFFTLVFGRDY